MVGLASCAQGGFYFFHLLDRYAAGYSMLFTVFFEAIAVSWIYGEYIKYIVFAQKLDLIVRIDLLAILYY